MPDDPRIIFQEWREADRSATHAETSLLDAALIALTSERPAPTEAEWQEAKRLRAHAKKLFEAAMRSVSELNARAASLTDGMPIRSLRTSDPGHPISSRRDLVGKEAGSGPSGPAGHAPSAPEDHRGSV